MLDQSGPVGSRLFCSLLGRPSSEFRRIERSIGASLRFEEDASARERNQGVKPAWRNIHAHEGAARLEDGGLRLPSVLGEEDDSDTSPDHHNRLCLLRVEVPMRTDIRVGFDGVEESVTTRVVSFVEIPIASQSRG